MSGRSRRYPAELKERAVRMVLEHQDEYPSQWRAICSIGEQLGVHHESLRVWVRRAETDAGFRPGLTTDEPVEGARTREPPVTDPDDSHPVMVGGGHLVAPPAAPLSWSRPRSIHPGSSPALTVRVPKLTAAAPGIPAPMAPDIRPVASAKRPVLETADWKLGDLPPVLFVAAMPDSVDAGGRDAATASDDLVEH